jgi:hypothetical protein
MNSSEEITIMDGADSADFADGGTGSKKIIRTIPASDLVAQNQMVS